MKNTRSMRVAAAVFFFGMLASVASAQTYDLTGTVTETGATLLKFINSNIIWQVRTGVINQAIVSPFGFPNDMSRIRVGDLIEVMGTSAPDRANTLDAASVSDDVSSPTYLSPNETFISGKIGDVTPTSTNSGSFTMIASDGKTLQVSAPSSLLWNKRGSPIMFYDIQPGDSVEIFGIPTANAIVATNIRDYQR